MKTKKELTTSHGSSSASWRNIQSDDQKKIKAPQPEAPKNFRIGAYIRLSPTGEDRLEGSLVSHPQRIKQFVEIKNLQHGNEWGQIFEWYEDKDYSGKDMNRPAFQKLLRDIKSGEVNAVIVTELSRLNRKVKDFLDVWEFFKQHKVAFFSLRESFDTSTHMGELMLIQAMSYAQYERQSTVARLTDNSRARAERGLAHAGLILGLDFVEHRPNHRQVIKSEQAYVKKIFKKFLELKSVTAVADYLNEKGYKTKEYRSKTGKVLGGNRWGQSSVHNVLTNRAYIGEREINKGNRNVDPVTLKEDARYSCVKAQWPALIGRELFYDVQALLEENKNHSHSYTHEYRLSGVVKCAECGYPLIGKSGNGKNAKYFYYGHARKKLVLSDRHLQRCKIENIPALALEEAVISRIKDLSTDKGLVKQLISQTADQSRKGLEDFKTLLASKEQERRKLEGKLKNLNEAIADESDRQLRQGLAQTARSAQGQLEQTEQAIQELKKDLAGASNIVDISAVMEYVKIFRNGAFDAMSISEQSQVLKARIRQIIVRQNGIHLEVFGKEPEAPLGQVGQSEFGRTQGSGVRTAFRLVQSARVERATLAFGGQYSIH